MTDDLTEAAADLVARLDAAWNAHDMDAFCALTTDDVHWVNTVGMHWKGRREVHHAHVAFHAGMFRTTGIATEEIESVTPLTPDVAVVVARHAVEGFDTPTGRRPPSRDRFTIVIKRTPEGWRIAHAANVPIFEQAQAHDPVRELREAVA